MLKSGGCPICGGVSMSNQKELRRLDAVILDDYHRPINCPVCGGIMVFKGVGEYECEDCHQVEYDDYGKVRLYIEKHRGATAGEVEQETGVSQKTIRKLLRDERIEVTPDSRAFLRCEVCGEPIRSGRYCQKCQVNVNRRIEEQARAKKKNMTGVGMGTGTGEEGARRFIRNKDRIR